MESFDIIIIGAGPAGSTSSYYLSKLGFKVALLEKKNIGREKICGGGLSSYALNELPFKLPDSVIERYIRGYNFVSPNNTIFTKKERNIVGATVYRSVFDSFLINKAVDANTTFIPNTSVKRIRATNNSYVVEEKYKSRYIIGADGANSIVKKAFKLGITQKSKYVGMRAILDFKDKGIEKYVLDPESIDFYFENGLRGYGWEFPLKNAINIGVGILGTGKNTINKKLVTKFALTRFNIPKEILSDSKIEGFPIPVSTMPNNFSRDNVFLIGDAAGLVDPISGEGVHYAIRSGKIVADTIVKDQMQLLNENASILFNKRIKKDIVADLRVTYKLRNFLDRLFMRNMDIWFKLMERNPFVFKYVQQLASKSAYYDIYKDVLNNIPKMVLDTIRGNVNIPGFALQQKLYN